MSRSDPSPPRSCGTRSPPPGRDLLLRVPHLAFHTGGQEPAFTNCCLTEARGISVYIPFTCPFVANRRQEDRQQQQQQQEDQDDEAEEERSLWTAFKKLRVDAARWIAAQPVGDGTVLTAPRRRAADGAQQPSVCCQEARNGLTPLHPPLPTFWGAAKYLDIQCRAATSSDIHAVRCSAVWNDGGQHKAPSVKYNLLITKDLGEVPFKQECLHVALLWEKPVFCRLLHRSCHSLYTSSRLVSLSKEKQTKNHMTCH
ncbi:uncharacterized protein LOC104914014 [Meleagris gallopavo]|uniref:uncharacterized protein LOC104914014 n=1 Tax=Meleagris gallopavo TaxID=9103 RepID=UPI0012ABF419|nr:uncharacterized protein LOC104914014 [Meleagris gallopavo]